MKNFKRDSTDSILEKVQANIFEPHRRKYVWCLFFYFEGGTASQNYIRQCLAGFSSQVTTGSSQKKESDTYRQAKANLNEATREKGIEELKKNLETVTCLFLSSRGCKKIMDKNGYAFPKDDAFKFGGMSSSSTRNSLKDLGVKEWQEGTWQKYSAEDDKHNKIDMMILLADNDKNKLKDYSKFIRKYFRNFCLAKHLFTEKGEMMYNENGDPIEPFGFRDGISQPPFWTLDYRSLLCENIDIALDDLYGSYLVFRKLEQDVAKFKEDINSLAHQIIERKKNPDSLDVEERFVEAQVFGRFKDGTPIAFSDEPILENGKADDEQRKQIQQFNEYGLEFKSSNNILNGDPLQGFNDPDGNRCPFHAHIRKTNPRERKKIIGRNNSYGGNEQIKLRIVRRGIPYIEEIGNIDAPAKRREGLLFMSYQASIRDQFEEIQKGWCNHAWFHSGLTKPEEGIDPIIGRRTISKPQSDYKWILEYGKSTETNPWDFQKLITLKGGDYFYAPSIPWLEALSTSYV